MAKFLILISGIKWSHGSWEHHFEGEIGKYETILECIPRWVCIPMDECCSEIAVGMYGDECDLELHEGL